jgi:hypothetical protein
MLLSDRNYYPYYMVGDFVTTSKFEALKKAHDKKINDVKFHFHDDVFSQQDWTTEPPEPLEELYRQRAEQLRNQYDYLILGFSGGADSTAIFDAFVKNNIHLDEVIMFHTLAGEDDRNSFYNFETFNVAMPYVEKHLKDKTTKITVIDQTKYTFDYWNIVNKFDFVHYNNYNFSPNNLARQYAKAHLPIFDESKSVAYITGIDKPCIVYNDGDTYFHFTDCIDTTVSYMYHDKGKTKHIDEFFFWTPNFPKIVIKQSHVLKKFLDRLDPNTLMLFVSQKLMYEQHGENTIVKNQKFYRMTNELMIRLIYPSWDINTPSVGKSNTGFIYSQRDSWFFKTGREEVKNYLNAMEHYLMNVGGQFKEFEGKGLKKIKTKLYPLQKEIE